MTIPSHLFQGRRHPLPAFSRLRAASSAWLSQVLPGCLACQDPAWVPTLATLPGFGVPATSAVERTASVSLRGWMSAQETWLLVLSAHSLISPRPSSFIGNTKGRVGPAASGVLGCWEDRSPLPVPKGLIPPSLLCAASRAPGGAEGEHAVGHTGGHCQALGAGGEESSGILFQQTVLSRGGEGGGEGERDLFKATLLLVICLVALVSGRPDCGVACDSPAHLSRLDPLSRSAPRWAAG